MAFEKIEIIKEGRYEICKIKSGKGNPLGSKTIIELKDYFDDFHERGAEGVIITSDGPIFTVGLDMKEMMQLNPGEFQHFFDEFLQLVHYMVALTFPLIAAINGHSPAGGCVLALCADYRVMADHENYKIGLNELPVGIMVPPAIFHLYAFWLGNSKAYENLLTGRMLNPLEAKQQGLVNEIVPDSEVLGVARNKMEEILSFDQATWRGIKSNARMTLVDKMKEDSENGHIGPVEHFVKNDGKKLLMEALSRLKK